MRHFTETFVAEDGRVTRYVADAPAVTEIEVVVNDGGVPDPAVSISKLIEFDVPPPGAGVCTVTEITSAVTTLAAGTCAVSCVALTYCVFKVVVPQLMVDAAVNPAPFTVSVKAALPALMNAGERLDNDGGGAGRLTT